MFKRILHGFVLLALLAGLLAVSPVQPAAASVESKGIAPEGYINPDGSLNLPGNTSGTFDLTGWSVQVDTQRGPVFTKQGVTSPAPSASLATPGNWTNAGGWSGPITNGVNAIAVIGTDVYVGGYFTDAGSVPAADYVARWDGSNWYALGSNGAGNGSLASSVICLAVNGSNLYVGGNFTNVNNGGTSLGAADFIAKWDGTNWSALGSNGAGNGSLNTVVNAIAVNGTDVYAGGNFSDVNNNGSVIAEADYVAKFDGSNWSALGGSGNGVLNSSVRTLVVDGSSNVYVGGWFTDAAGIPEADYIAKWNGAAWSALSGNGAGNGSINNVVHALAVSGTDVYVGGQFINVNNGGTTVNEADYIAKWDGTNWLALGSNGAGNGSVAHTVYAILINGSDIYIGGSFINVNNSGTSLTSADCVAKWNGASWSALGSNGSGNGALGNTCFSVSGLGLSGGSLYAGGGFTDPVNNGSALNLADYVARFDGTDWSGLGSTMNGAIHAPVFAIAPGSSFLYAGGTFYDASNQGVNIAAFDNFGQWDGTNWSAVGSIGMSNFVNIVVVNGSNVYVGGSFTNAGGIPEADYIAKWDGASWSALGNNGAGNGSLNSGINGIAIDGSNVYVAGSFTNVNNGGAPLAAADFVAKWDGTNWSALGSNGSGNGSINNGAMTITTIGSDVYVGGFFNNVNNGGTVLTAADYIAKWDGTNWSALGSNGSSNGSIIGTVYALKASGTDLYVGGSFDDVNNNGVSLPTADSIAKWNTLTGNWSALGDNGAGNGAMNGFVMAIAINGTDVYVGGGFTNAGGVATADYVARWNGAAWSALGSNGAGDGSLNRRVNALAIWNNDLYVGGEFNNVNNGGTTLHQADYIAAFGINSAPTNISLNPSSVLENQPAGTTVGALSATDVNISDTHTYSFACTVPGADDASFQISGSNLQTAASFDYETKNSYNICIRANDGNGGVFDKNFTIAITDVNENQTPTNISITNASVLENQPASTTVGTLSTTDPDVGDIHSYSFACATPGANDSSFQISGSTLQTAAVFNYEVKNSYAICIRTNDGNGGTFDKNFTITVTDVPGLELLSPANGASLPIVRPTFDWDNLSGATSYQIQASKNASFPNTQLVINKTVTTSDYAHTGNLTANTLFYWRVRAKVGGVWGAWSTTWSFTTGNPPSAPSLVAPANNALINGPSPLFDWNNSTVSGGAVFDHYQIQVATDNAFANIIHDHNIAGVTNSSDNDIVLNPAATYYWRVRSFAADGDYSAWSSAFTVKIKMPAPTLVSPANLTVAASLKPTFTWNAVVGATGYTIQISKSLAFGFGTISSNPVGTSFTPGSNLSAGTKYYWRVRANSLFTSDWSIAFSFTTP